MSIGMKGGAPTPWTAERIEQLKEFWAAGYSCGQIARTFGCSRNSVIGKKNRLRLSARRETIYIAGIAHTRDLVKVKAIEPLKPVMAPPIESLRIPLLQVVFTQCRYPLWGDDGAPDFIVCGNSCSIVEPYCEPHAQICAGKGTHSERRASRAPKVDAPEAEAA